MVLESSGGTPARNEVIYNPESLKSLTAYFGWNFTSNLNVATSGVVEEGSLFEVEGCKSL